MARASRAASLLTCAAVAASLSRGAGAGRVVAVADLHGDWNHTVTILRAAGLAEFPVEGQEDEALSSVRPPFGRYRGVRWVGGDATLVQTGDIVDRGDHARDIYAAFAELRRQAGQHGGRVVNLVGNHELMNIMNDLRYVSPGDFAAFGGRELRQAAWAPDGEVGRQVLDEFEPFAVLEDTLFVHAGLLPDDARIGAETLKQTLREALRDAARGKGRSRLLQATGPFWVRRIAEGDESVACPLVAETLQLLGAKRMVIGHTQVDEGRVRRRCAGALLMADTIISKDAYPMCWQAARNYGGEDAEKKHKCAASMSYLEFKSGQELDGSSHSSAVAVRLISVSEDGQVLAQEQVKVNIIDKLKLEL